MFRVNWVPMKRIKGKYVPQLLLNLHIVLQITKYPHEMIKFGMKIWEIGFNSLKKTKFLIITTDLMTIPKGLKEQEPLRELITNYILFVFNQLNLTMQ